MTLDRQQCDDARKCDAAATAEDGDEAHDRLGESLLLHGHFVDALDRSRQHLRRAECASKAETGGVAPSRRTDGAGVHGGVDFDTLRAHSVELQALCELHRRREAVQLAADLLGVRHASTTTAAVATATASDKPLGRDGEASQRHWQGQREQPRARTARARQQSNHQRNSASSEGAAPDDIIDWTADNDNSSDDVSGDRRATAIAWRDPDLTLACLGVLVHFGETDTARDVVESWWARYKHERKHASRSARPARIASAWDDAYARHLVRDVWIDALLLGQGTAARDATAGATLVNAAETRNSGDGVGDGGERREQSISFDASCRARHRARLTQLLRDDDERGGADDSDGSDGSNEVRTVENKLRRRDIAREHGRRALDGEMSRLLGADQVRALRRIVCVQPQREAHSVCNGGTPAPGVAANERCGVSPTHGACANDNGAVVVGNDGSADAVAPGRGTATGANRRYNKSGNAAQQRGQRTNGPHLPATAHLITADSAVDTVDVADTADRYRWRTAYARARAALLRCAHWCGHEPDYAANVVTASAAAGALLLALAISRWRRHSARQARRTAMTAATGAVPARSLTELWCGVLRRNRVARSFIDMARAAFGMSHARWGVTM